MVGAKRAVHPGTRHFFRVEWELKGLSVRGESVLGGPGSMLDIDVSNRYLGNLGFCNCQISYAGSVQTAWSGTDYSCQIAWDEDLSMVIIHNICHL